MTNFLRFVKIFGFSNKPSETYVMGLSMGGYGALKCLFTTLNDMQAAALSRRLLILIHEKRGGTQRSREMANLRVRDIRVS